MKLLDWRLLKLVVDMVVNLKTWSLGEFTKVKISHFLLAFTISLLFALSDSMKPKRQWFEYKDILSKCVLMDSRIPWWSWCEIQVYGVSSFQQLENGMYEMNLLSWSNSQSHPLQNTCTRWALKAQVASAFLAHQWKWGLRHNCGLRERGEKNLVAQLKGFPSSYCLTCCLLYPRQTKSPKASICGSKIMLARRGHPVTLQVHGVPCFINYYYYSEPSFAWVFAYFCTLSVSQFKPMQCVREWDRKMWQQELAHG